MTGKTSSTWYALKIALPYLLVGWTWILFSDRFLQNTISDLETLTILQTYKGWFFITMSALLVYLTAQHYLARLSRTSKVVESKDLALTENQHGMFSLLANLPGMAYRCQYDDLRQMEFVSQGCLALTGFESTDFTRPDSAPYVHIIVVEDREMIRHEINRAVRDRTAFQIEYRIRTKNGRVKWVSEQGCGIHSATEGKKLLVGYIFEIDEAGLQDRRRGANKGFRTDSSNHQATVPGVNQS